MQPIIQFNNVTKRYFIERDRKLKNDLLNPFQKTDTRTFRALKNISFEIFPKETIGLIGPNGSGKTTILRLIAGITFPSSGTIKVGGKVAPLIELGAGFHPEFSGKENVYLNGAILGMSIQEIQCKFNSILDFAGNTVQQFIDTPLKKYSLGMKARLGFSIAIHTLPDILLVDESLSVGDQEFKNKCMSKLKELKQKGKTIVMTSHNTAFLESFCTRTIHLEKGKILTS
jgi:ABC-type polysaccharide/polyol phosphate transport system ATPase subunit